MIQIIIQQIVMDRRDHENTDSFSSTFGLAVGTVIQSFSELERLKDVESQFEYFKRQYEQISAEKESLLSEVAKLRILPSQLEFDSMSRRMDELKEENDSLRDLLRTSKETIAMLQSRLAQEEGVRKDQASETVSYMFYMRHILTFFLLLFLPLYRLQFRNLPGLVKGLLPLVVSCLEIYSYHCLVKDMDIRIEKHILIPSRLNQVY